MWRTGLGGIALGAVLLAGCGTESAAPEDGAPADGPSVGGAPEGVAGKYLVDADGGWDPVGGVEVEVTFSRARVDFYAGCNRHSGELSWDGDTLVTPGLGGTEIGCSKGLNDQDAWLADFLSDRPTATVRGDDVELTSGEVTVYLVPDVDVPDAELVGTTWRLEAIAEYSGDFGGVSTIPDSARTILRFDEDGSVALDLSCNAGGASYTIDQDLIRFGDIESDGAGCRDVKGAVEEQVTGVLGTGELEWSISEDRLLLAQPNGGLADAWVELQLVADPA